MEDFINSILDAGPVWLVLTVYALAACIIIVPIGLAVDAWLARRRQRREFLRSIIRKV
jgi:ABC-type molybdate transport system permease subunit